MIINLLVQLLGTRAALASSRHPPNARVTEPLNFLTSCYDMTEAGEHGTQLLKQGRTAVSSTV